MKDNLPQRKHPRLKEYDYSSSGAYFITICTQNKRHTLSTVVGRGLAPAEICEVHLSKYGKIAERELLSLEERYHHLSVDQYVIMPNHIHAIFVLIGETAGASPRPTISDIICTYKSLTARKCKNIGLSEKLFQTSFFEHVIRDREDYETRRKYIYNNPIRWYYEEIYDDE